MAEYYKDDDPEIASLRLPDQLPEWSCEDYDEDSTDHVLYLARMIPKMCLTDTAFHEWSHDCVYEYIGTSEASYDRPILSAPCASSDSVFVMEQIKGSDVRDMFPQLPDDLMIRPSARYAVVCVCNDA